MKSMRNTLGDLNNHLFAQMERLSNEELKGEELVEEMQRAKAITGVATQIINNGTLVLQTQKLADDYMNADVRVPKMLEGGG